MANIKMKVKFNPKIYLVTDRKNHTEKSFLQTIETACKYGATLVQLREKEISTLEYLNLAKKVKNITDKYNIPLIIDDKIDIALAVNASGVHLGSSDMPIKIARSILGENKIIGATAKTLEIAKKAHEDGADYLGVGAIYPTSTKVITKITKVETLDKICENISLPVVAIGGLNDKNIDILKNSKIAGIAIVSYIMQACDVELATKQLLEKMKLYGF